MRKQGLYIFLIFSLAVFCACNPTRRLADDQIFLKKQDIKVSQSEGEFDVSKDEMEPVLKTRPNRRILLFFKFHLWAYNLFSEDFVERKHQKKAERRERRNERRERKGKEPLDSDFTTGWGRFKYDVGEPPAVFDTAKAEKSIEQLNIFLTKEGYFNNEVDYSLKYSKDSSRAELTYRVVPKRPYRLRNLEYVIKDENIQRVEDLIVRQSILDSNEIFKVSRFDDERERIANYLNNRGYYRFSKDYIIYQADSAVGDHQVDVELILRTPQVRDVADSLSAQEHKRYYIGKVFVHTDYNPIDPGYGATDTTEHRGVKFLYNKTLGIKPEQLYYNIFIFEGDMYQKDDVSATYRRLNQLGVFRSVNIQFEVVDEFADRQILESHIYLSPAEKQTLSVETRGTNREGILGIQANLGYQHRNIFRGGEELSIRLNTGFEAQQLLTETDDEQELNTSSVQDNLSLNTFEIGPEVSLKVNRLFPLSLRQISRTNNPTTTFSTEFNYQTRPDYERTVSQFRMSYKFTESEGSNIFIDPLSLSVIKIQKSDLFQQRLEEINDQFLLTSYQDHLIASSGISWVNNTQRRANQRTYSYNKISGEFAGNTLRGILSASDVQPDEAGSYRLLNIQFAQYWKLENDFRYYKNYNEKNTVVYRIAGGYGQPLANLGRLPFEKAFFAGGANGIRAWQARTLGPGSFRDSTALTTYNNIGEIKISANVEYRFGLTNTIEGALFVDAGNIWLIEEEELRPGSGFSEDFLGEIAIGTGLGIRLDFDFFLIRFDFGVQLKDPAKVPGERWAWEPKTEYNDYKRTIAEMNDNEFTPYRPRVNLNLGIGYPF
ncbi:translocation and assembly module lipoprotein TamL [Halocola ammonii]